MNDIHDKVILILCNIRFPRFSISFIIKPINYYVKILANKISILFIQKHLILNTAIYIIYLTYHL